MLQECRITITARDHAIPVDVRVIAATHGTKLDLVAQRSFRQDLYYRLNTLSVTELPVAGPQEDIPALAQHPLRQSLALRVARTPRCRGRAASPGDALQRHGWPGNVRELENLCDRLAAHRTASMDTGLVR